MEAQGNESGMDTNFSLPATGSSALTETEVTSNVVAKDVCPRKPRTIDPRTDVNRLFRGSGLPRGMAFIPPYGASEPDDAIICVLCDGGGNLLTCYGPCSRYFHGFIGTGTESFCPTLGLSMEERKDEPWYCKNCEMKQQQCFVCNELGSTDVTLGEPQVYMCEEPTCKRFFHAQCVNERVFYWDHGKKKRSAIVICPRHKCDTCGFRRLNYNNLVQCRRCPKSWHLECLINYDRSGELEETKIWNHGPLQFLFCRRHKVIPGLTTPERNHIRFPG